MNWTTSRFGGEHLKVAGGLIKASVQWSLHREDPGYKVYINDFTYKKTFETMDEAKAAVELRIRQLLKKAQEEIQ